MTWGVISQQDEGKRYSEGSGGRDETVHTGHLLV